MARLGKRRLVGRRGSGWSISYEGPDIEALVSEKKEAALRDSVIEAAEEVAAKEGFGDNWEIEVELNMDDGRTIQAAVVKKPDGEPQITAWEAKVSGDTTS